MIIREAGINDLDSIQELYLHLHETEKLPDSNELCLLWKKIINDKNYHILVGEIDGKVISSVTLVVIPNLTRGAKYQVDYGYRNGGSRAVKSVRFYGNKPYKAAVVHGGPGALGSVAAIARELSKDFGVIEPLQTRDSISELLEELDEVITACCDRPITLIGHSWGAWLVFMYAAKYPRRVKKVILVGSGPFEVQYVSDIADSRMKRLSDTEGVEFDELLKRLNSDKEIEKDRLLKRLGALANKSDNYCAFEIDTDKEDCLPVEGDKYSNIWKEAAALRESGELLGFADKITCPVVAIHGEYDPHPIDGVKLSLQNKVKDFTIYTLGKCGHSPWKEKHAHQEFYEILRKELGE